MEEIHHKIKEDILTITIKTLYLDFMFLSKYHKKIISLVENIKHKFCVLDISETQCIDSTGMFLLLEINRKKDRNNFQVVVAEYQDKLLTNLNLKDILNIYLPVAKEKLVG